MDCVAQCLRNLRPPLLNGATRDAYGKAVVAQGVPTLQCSTAARSRRNGRQTARSVTVEDAAGSVGGTLRWRDACLRWAGLNKCAPDTLLL